LERRKLKSEGGQGAKLKRWNTEMLKSGISGRSVGAGIGKAVWGKAEMLKPES
jgi:hypothetical protein